MAPWRRKARESANARGAWGVSSPRRQSAGPRSGDFCRPRAGVPRTLDALSQRCGAGRGATRITRACAEDFLTGGTPHGYSTRLPIVRSRSEARAEAGASLRLTNDAQSAKRASCSKIPRRRACHRRRTNPVLFRCDPHSPRSRLGLPDGRQGGRRTLEERLIAKVITRRSRSRGRPGRRSGCIWRVCPAWP